MKVSEILDVLGQQETFSYYTSYDYDYNVGVLYYADLILYALDANEDITQESQLLNGSGSWQDYSYDGKALTSDEEIAARLCSPSEFIEYEGGKLSPSTYHDWRYVQAKALFDAADIIMSIVHHGF